MEHCVAQRCQGSTLNFRSYNTLLKAPNPKFNLKQDQEKLTHR